MEFVPFFFPCLSLSSFPFLFLFPFPFLFLFPFLFPYSFFLFLFTHIFLIFSSKFLLGTITSSDIDIQTLLGWFKNLDGFYAQAPTVWSDNKCFQVRYPTIRL